MTRHNQFVISKSEKKNVYKKASSFYFLKLTYWSITIQLFRQIVREWLIFDSSLFKSICGFFGLLLAELFSVCEKPRKVFQIFSLIHAAACSSWSTGIIVKKVKEAITDRRGNTNSFRPIFCEHIGRLQPTPHTQKFFDNPQRLLGAMAIVLKSAKDDEKGVILINYSYAFPLFFKLFNIGEITRRYFLVLEPSWSGYCNLDVLCSSQLDCPIFIQAYEPKDAEFLWSLESNLIPVPLGNNWWADHRTFRSLPHVPKDIDVIMVASWANFKRHVRFFHVLKQMRRRGIILKVVLVGYPMDKTRDIICREVEHYGIEDQLEIYESITPEEVNYQFNRAKVNVLWSRREGWNRALVEGMLAGTPCILREGHNYGFAYPYINHSTGCYSSEQDLAESLTWMLEHYQEFCSRSWVMEHMSCQKATQILEEHIREVAREKGEKWREGLSVKVNGVHGMSYWDNEDKKKFDPDYEFLSSCIR